MADNPDINNISEALRFLCNLYEDGGLGNNKTKEIDIENQIKFMKKDIEATAIMVSEFADIYLKDGIVKGKSANIYTEALESRDKQIRKNFHNKKRFSNQDKLFD